MKFEFLGHGLFDDQDNTVGNYLHKSFQDKNFNSFQCFVAFTTLSGLSVFMDKLVYEKERYKTIEFYLGIDDKGTSREALTELLDKKIDTYIYHNPTRRTRAIYHPKLYIFRGEKANRIILGSSNLTRPGLSNNIEASFAMDFVTGNLQGTKLINQIEKYFASFFGKNHENLRKLDDELIKYLAEKELILSEKTIFKSEEEKEKSILIDELGTELFNAREAAYVDLEDLLNIESETNERKYRLRTVALTEYYFAKWSDNFEKFKQFKAKHKTVIVPNDFENPTLYGWYLKQKALYKENRIPEEHLIKLIEVDFHFGDGHKVRFDQIWENYYDELKKYFKAYGHSDVPRRKDRNDPFYRLSNFVASQRHFKKKSDSRMTEYRRLKLEELNFTWEVGPKNVGVTIKHDDQWLENLTRYSEFKKTHRREPKQTRNTDEYKIGKWRSDQAVFRKQGSLSQERIDLLEAEGIIWDLEEHEFNQKVELLAKFQEEFEHFNVPLNYVIDGISLGQFVYSLKKRGTKYENQTRLLNIGFTEAILRSDAQPTENKKNYITIEWSQNYEQLKELKVNGIKISEIERDSIQYPKLGKWIYNQQKRYRHSKLSEEQETMLNELGLKMSKEDTNETRWSVFYELLTEYKKEFGNCRVPRSFDSELYTWIWRQKGNRQKNILTKERLEKLNELQFEWSAPKNKNGL